MSCGFEAAGIGVRFLLAAALFSALSLFGQGKLGSEGEAAHVTIVSFEGKLEFSRAGSQRWDPSYTNQVLSAGDRLRTGERSRALVRFSNTMIRLGELSYLAVPGDTLEQPLITLFKGFFYFFHRDQPGHFGLRTPTASAVARGTELNVQISDDDTSTFTVLDGSAEVSAGRERVELEGKEQVVVAPGKAPVRTAVLNAANVIQWCLYYPAVLCLNDLDLDPAARPALGESLAAYQAGDLKTALANYPAGRVPATPAEKVYLAALLISIGEIEKGKSFLDSIGREEGKLWRVREALLTLVAAVRYQPPSGDPTSADRLATEWLADSYWQQSRSKLPEALAAAQKAGEIAPDSGFGWARVAELEFCFGEISKARAALERSLELAPRNAQALALKGFLLSALGKVTDAREFFDKAIAADSASGNAWLGRGLCRIRRGDSSGGVKDLMVAAALEPQRALLRSYLGKAYTQVDDFNLASKELKLAIELDPKDPTPWLYSALLKQQQNRVNEAIGDLEISEKLNDNRSLFRSRLLLDEDLAVSSANLASIYRDAGMTDVSVREASRAVTCDYANAAAHLFLSDSYNDLRDPTRFNLRYETVWFNELLLANLLSPLGGGRLSQQVSQQEYSRLFQEDGLGLANSTLGRSDNKSVTELASQYGTFDSTSYAFDLDYQYNDGVRPNNGLDSIEWYTTVKQQITPQDTLLALVKYEDYHSGDNFQYYDPTNARPNYRFDEYQQPIVVGGWHHEWSPGVHTLLLGGRLETEQYFSDIAAPQLTLIRNNGAITLAGTTPLDVNYHNEFEIYLAELNQLFQWNRITLSLGGRWQGGSFQTQAQFANSPLPLTSNPFAQVEGFNRLTGYGYLTVEPLDRLWLTGGAAYDDITYPDNFRNPPLSPGEAHTYQLGPKAGLVWNPVPLLTLRGAYTRSLGGVSEDESYRLEQTQVAGSPQTFRSLISESVVGSVAAPKYETYSVALDLKFPSRTYAGIQAQRLNTDVDRTVGALALDDFTPPFVTTSTLEQLRCHENSIGASINQLLGDDLVVGASYTFDRVELGDVYPNIPVAGYATTQHNDLHETAGYVLFNHPSGLFARADATWYHQINSQAGQPGDDFVQENLYVGYRFLHRHAELMFGILNLSGQNYNLNPLNTYMELPRERSYIVRLNFVF